MSGQRRWLKLWSRTVGMPVGLNDDDKPEFLPITQDDVTRHYGSELSGLSCIFVHVAL